jgi:RNA polymerase sigma-70 factor (ECF subfamily)
LVNFRGDSALGTWLHRIATNLSHNRYWYFFRRHRQDTLSLDCAVGESNTATFSDLMAAVDRDPAQETVSNEFIALVDQCMARLDKRHHEILTLRNILDHSYQEVAVILGISVGTVKSRIARARDSLRALLTETCPEFAPGAKAMDWFLRVPALYGRPVIVSA